MTTTVRDSISAALRLVNAIDPGESPDAEEFRDALGTLNDMLDAWQTEKLALPYTASVEFATVPGQKVYSIGPAGNWNGVRPAVIRNALLRSGGVDTPIRLLSQDQYAAIPVKNTASPIPTSLYYEAQYPLGFVTLYPVPSAAAGVVLSYDAQFTLVTLDSDLTTLPPGYRHAIKYCLAVLLGAEYGKPASQDVQRVAADAYARIKAINVKSPDAVFDAAIPGVHRRSWDWRNG